MRPLDDAQLYRALRAHDPRFDGVFFVGITSTRIYCRPVCRAPAARAENCRYFSTAAAAERRGFRPCLRCRPELAPASPTVADDGANGEASVDAVARLARGAATRIAAGALDTMAIDELASQLGVTGRHLRRAVTRELGVTPVELAQTRRLLMAKRLLADSSLPLSRVALASGFSSVRRFNTLFRERYRLTPGDVRRRALVSAEPSDAIVLSLAYRPPYDWSAMLAHLAARATPGVEHVSDDGVYRRTIEVDGHAGQVALRPSPGRDVHALRVELSPSLLSALAPLLARLRRLLDLDADPSAITGHLRRDATLAPLVARRPGLRVAGAADAFELALRAVLGQQVTVRGATTLAGRLARSIARPMPESTYAELTHLPVTAARLADARVSSLTDVGLTRARAECVVTLARAVADGTLPELAGDGTCTDPASFVRRFVALPGIGPWTADYVAMRALRWPDAFPAGDLGLRKAMGGLSAAKLRAASEPWRPWRAYAAQHLWASL
jgi:AraC family transcriptional regulator of adaptative response / DNA-3-methyladenine glycosylase II